MVLKAKSSGLDRTSDSRIQEDEIKVEKKQYLRFVFH